VTDYEMPILAHSLNELADPLFSRIHVASRHRQFDHPILDRCESKATSLH
jgi:hypothetical protein